MDCFHLCKRFIMATLKKKKNCGFSFIVRSFIHLTFPAAPIVCHTLFSLVLFHFEHLLSSGINISLFFISHWDSLLWGHLIENWVRWKKLSFLHLNTFCFFFYFINSPIHYRWCDDGVCVRIFYMYRWQIAA